MNRLLLAVCVMAVVLAGCGGCGQWSAPAFDPTNQASVDSLAAKVQPTATLAAAALAVELKPDDVAQLASVLQEVRACIAGDPARAVNVDAIAALVINKVTGDPAKQAQYARLVHAATAIVSIYVPAPPAGSTAATVLTYAKAAQQLTLAAIDGALAALPAPDAPPASTVPATGPALSVPRPRRIGGAQ
jgi:type IV secretory pathway VirB2 component (pilin)